MVALNALSGQAAGGGAAPSGDDAAALTAQACAGGTFDAAALATRLTTLAQGDPQRAGTQQAQVEARLTAVERGELARALDAGNDNGPAPGAAAPAGVAGPDPVQLGLDLGQMALDITGIVDPTPISDGTNAVVSVGRSIGSAISGDWGGAGGHLGNAGISALGIAVGVGDLAKLGKVGKWAQTVSDSVAAIAHNPALRGTLAPALEKVRDAINAIPDGALARLPAGARDSITATRRQLDDFFAGGTQASARAAVHGAKIGANSAEWTLNAAGEPTRVTATLRELQPAGTPRGKAELDAQDAVRGRGKADDDAGHVIGHRFLGDQGARNMFPQNFNFNRSAYKKLENEWADWIGHGGTVKVDVELIGGKAGRPDQVGVSYEVFDDAERRIFDNQELFANAAGQVFDRVPAAEMSARLAR